jgi:sulfopyruvate decarboxylase alpha subunit
MINRQKLIVCGANAEPIIVQFTYAILCTGRIRTFDDPRQSLVGPRQCMSGNKSPEGWEEAVVRVLRKNDISLVTYVPDNVLSQLIRLIENDPFFTVISPAREEEAVGIVAGAYMAGKRGIVLMQTSGFATIVNALASLACPYQLPIVVMVSERGTLGEFQLGQSIVCRTMRPVLQSLGMEHFAIQDRSQVEFVVNGIIQQAYATQAPAAIILSPLLTKRAA